MSRHKHRPTDEQRRQVLSLAGLGLKQDDIAGLLRVAPKTLRLRYRNELNTGATRANAAVAQSLFHMAVKDKVPSAAIFWLKARAGWKEQQDINVGGTDRPVQVDFTWAPALTVATASPVAPAIDAEAEADSENAANGAEGQLVVRWGPTS
jgi:hypothetical protein